MTKRPNQRRQPNTQKQARADLWDMLNAFTATPDIQSMHFANSVGEINVTRVERGTPSKRIGFDATCAVSIQSIGAPDDEEEDYDYGNADYSSDEIRPAEDFWKFMIERYGK